MSSPKLADCPNFTESFDRSIDKCSPVCYSGIIESIVCCMQGVSV